MSDQQRKRSARRRRAPACIVAVVTALATLVSAPEAGAFTPYPNTSCSGTNPGGTVSYNNCDANFTLFSNGDGDYVIYKQCTAVGGGFVGPGYIAKFTASLSGQVVTNDIPLGNNLLQSGKARDPQAGNDPAQGGWGFFTTYLARGMPSSTTGNFDFNSSWSLSQRSCRNLPDPTRNQAFGPGVRSATPLAIGFGPSGTGNFEEEIVLTDSYTDSDPGGLITLRVRWRIDSSGARLYLRVTESCANGQCSGGGQAWIKEPRVSAQMNGQAGTTGWTHYSTFTPTGTKIYGECNRFASSFSRPEVYTQHCIDEQMTRWRLDYGDGDTGGCTAAANQPCMNVVGRAISVANFDAGNTSPTYRWKGTGLGFDWWANEASKLPAAGSTVCGARPPDPWAYENRNWELVGYNMDGNGHFGWDFGQGYRGGQVGIVLKAWEGCVGPPDGTAFYRPLGPDPNPHAVYIGFSINSGWFLMEGSS